jgi:glucosyl-dolichyl phosphate glucuronosyltransferase
MKLNVIVPTYNRAASLRKTLASLAQAALPADFEVVVTIVNNNSTDETAQTVEEMRAAFAGKKLEYLFEEKQGRSYALNTGIKSADGDLLTTVDDDVRVAENWFVEIEKVFRARWNEIDFAGGKMLPEWEDGAKIPAWIEPLKDGVLSWRDYGDEEWTYGPETPMLTGGHAIFKRSVFDEIGPFAEGVGAAGKNLMSCEDDILYDKLLTAGKRGVYFPQLVVYHFMPGYRVSKSYYRQWCFGAGMSWNLMDTYYKAFEGKRVLGVPRYLYKEAIVNFFRKLKAVLTRETVVSLSSERKILIFAGYFYTKNMENTVFGKLLSSIVKKAIKPAKR